MYISMRDYLFLGCCILLNSSTLADENTHLAQQLTNPVAHLISVPFQYNYNTYINKKKTGYQNYLNFQPVVPVILNSSWTLISRTILPLVSQGNVLPGSGSQFGFGDILQSLFFSPNVSNIIWGAGPVISIPTASDNLLGSGKWEIGPTAVVLKITGPWTIGGLGYQIWSVAGDNSRPAQSLAYLQPFIAYTTKTAWTYTLNSESTYNWKESTLSAPFNLMITKLFTVKKLPISVGGGLRYWAHSPHSGPKHFGARFSITFLFPKN